MLPGVPKCGPSVKPSRLLRSRADAHGRSKHRQTLPPRRTQHSARLPPPPHAQPRPSRARPGGAGREGGHGKCEGRAREEGRARAVWGEVRALSRCASVTSRGRRRRRRGRAAGTASGAEPEPRAPSPDPSGRSVAGGTAGARATPAGLGRSIAAGSGRAGKAIHASIHCGREGKGGRESPFPSRVGGRRAAAGVGQAIPRSWGNASRPLSLRLINTVIELLIHCSVAAQGPVGPGRNNDPVFCGSLTLTSASRFLQDSAFPSLGSARLKQSSSPLHFTAWHLDGNRSWWWSEVTCDRGAGLLFCFATAAANFGWSCVWDLNCFSSNISFSWSRT